MVNWHLKEVDTILSDLNTSKEAGLCHAVAQEKLEKYGINALT